VTTDGDSAAGTPARRALAGLLSVALAIAAFLSVHRPLPPWRLLLAAAVALAGDVPLAAAYCPFLPIVGRSHPRLVCNACHAHS
jgi:hypothetical protein